MMGLAGISKQGRKCSPPKNQPVGANWLGDMSAVMLRCSIQILLKIALDC